jgi:hypothetical protein
MKLEFYMKLPPAGGRRRPPMAVQQSGDGCSLPVYFRFPTDERVIAVTVDDC